MANRLFYADNLDALRAHVADASVDLVYLDPPFNSNANFAAGGTNCSLQMSEIASREAMSIEY